jgi:hypothetical protein
MSTNNAHKLITELDQDLKKIAFGPLQKIKTPHRVNFACNGRVESYVFPSPCVAPYGVSYFKEKKDQGQEQKKDEKEKSRQNLEVTIESDEVYNVLKNFEKTMIEKALENYELWWPHDHKGKKPIKTEDDIRRAFTPMVKENLPYKPTLKTKVNLSGFDAYVTRFFNSDSVTVPYTDVAKRSEVFILVQFPGVWISASNAEWGITVNATDVMIFPQVRASNPFSSVNKATKTDENNTSSSSLSSSTIAAEVAAVATTTTNQDMEMIENNDGDGDNFEPPSILKT